MSIIVEGIDRVGKTTLCNKINKYFALDIFKESMIKNVDDIMTFNYGAMRSLCNVSKYKNFVFDRFHLSEYVYGVIERKYDISKALEIFKYIDNLISKDDNNLLILVEPIDLEYSSIQHGKSLKQHYEYFEYLYEISEIKNKFKCNYNSINEIIELLKGVIR